MSPDATGAASAERLEALLALSHHLGAEPRRLAILGEGNTSARLDAGTFLVKASGSSLGTLQTDDLVLCRSEALLPMLAPDAASPTDQEIEDALLRCRVCDRSKKPSVEALFHAYLLRTLPGVHFVGHTHPVSVNAILCSPRAREFAERRIFPDEVVCCGVASALVGYTDPGRRLAIAIREGCERFLEQHGRPPRVILLENHGIITLGATPQGVQAAMLMAVKAAEIFAGAAALGGPAFLGAEDVRRIDGRLDEHYRRQALQI